MKIFSFFRRTWLLILLTLAPVTGLLAASESYLQSLTGHLKKGDSLTVIDDKFLNLPLDQWNQLKHLSIDNVISFALRRDTSLIYNTKPFSCTLNVTIKYFTSRDQQNPKEIDSVKLVVNFDTVRGKPYIDVARYRFKNAFKVTVIINSISSPEWKDKMPDVFRLTNHIMVERKYPVDPNSKGKIHLGAIRYRDSQDLVAISGPKDEASCSSCIGITAVDGQITLSWLPTDFQGYEEYDLEWTYIDGQSDYAAAIVSSYGGASGPFNIPPDVVTQWMQHDATRVTVSTSLYTINLPYQDGYVLFRLRGAMYQEDGLRITSGWTSEMDDQTTALVIVPAHQANLNWQYTGTFAEEGKRKEVISYFDATQRSRQAVTINNSDEWTHTDLSTSPTAVVQETVYDVMGRPAVNVLPAPVKNSLLDFFPSFNKNASSGGSYRNTDIALDNTNGTSCAIAAPAMSTVSGASQYYSPANTFMDANNLANFYFNPYIPNAQGYPFSLTEYTPDNTGRIRRQGGVGPTFQVGGGHESNYYYGKPTASQLQRMFGMEVGDPSHYLKNMVIDANGQASVSYIDGNGKTIATALAGASPTGLSPLPTSDAATGKTDFNDVLIRPVDMRIDAGALSMSATATFLAETTDVPTVYYSVNPLALVTTYGGNNQLCNNCYYTLSVKATDDCGNNLGSATSTPFQGSDYTCHADAQPIVQNLPLTPLSRPGEINVTYTLQLSNDVVNAQTDYYISHNTDLRQLQSFFEQELSVLDLSGCYSTCAGCKALPKTVQDFTAKVQSLLSTSGYPNVTLTSAVQTWINNTYQTLVAKCASVSCTPTSPCEEKLGQLKQDVLPGGQYAEYDANALANGGTSVFLETQINVMMQYNQDATISALTFTAADGTTQTVGTLNQADFVRAYLQHPEWADYFVKYHIEYCSYLWCKDASNTTPADNNEVSYTFDASLQQNYTNGTDAVTAGYYNHSDPLALLKKDPWFNGGRGGAYYSNMQSDLQSLSTVLNMNVSDGTNTLPAKNIIQLVDWALYCKPTDGSATSAQVAASWSSCTPSDNCRSVTMEWQSYLNYYLQLKSKYYRIAKAAYFSANSYTSGSSSLPTNASCLDCFIGSDPLATAGCPPPGAVSNYSVIRADENGYANWYVVLNGGVTAYPGNYTLSYQYAPSGYMDPSQTYAMQTINVVAGQTRTLINSIQLPPPPEQLGSAGVYYFNAVACTPTALGACAASQGSTSDPGPCPDPSTFSISYGAQTISGPDASNTTTTTRNVYYVHAGGPVTRDVNITVTMSSSGTTLDVPYTNPSSTYTVTMSAGQTQVLIGTNTSTNTVVIGDVGNGSQGIIGNSSTSITYDVTAPYVTCSPAATVQASTCTGNSNYPLYLAKNKIFNDYVDIQDYSSCLASTAPTSSQAQQNLLLQATNNLVTQEASWLSRLQAIRDKEFSDLTATELTDNVLNNVVSNLYQVSYAYLQYASQQGLAMNVVSSLPSGVSASNSYSSFDQVFAALIPLDARQRGFSADLLDNVYPYNKTPYSVDPNVTRLTSDIYANVQNNLAAFQSAWNGQGSFGSYLKAQLGDDYVLTDDQLSDLQARLASGCPNPYLSNPAILPVAFVLPNPGGSGTPPVTAYVTCSQLSTLATNFASTYPNVTAGTQLYQTLYTDYFNHQLGYALSYADYALFTCPGTVVLYDKPASPSIVEDNFSCAANAIQGAYTRGGQDYDLYITQVRIAFRNAYISKCLSNNASANISGKQYEYHYTLYYYDQSGNLVKTIPPEGVHLLSDQDVATVAQLPAQDPSSCDALPSTVVRDQQSILSTLSTTLQSSSPMSMEMWLYTPAGGTTRQVRMVTPDNKFMVQAAIANGDIWFEVYTLQPDGSGGINMNLTNQAVAALPAQLTLQNWTHLMIVSPGGLASGALTLYVDGNRLTMLSDGSAPSYPFDWEVNGESGGFVLPVTDVSEAQQLRLYNIAASDYDVSLDYQNSCLTPKGELLGAPLQLWGLFNPPSFCSNTASTTPVSVADQGALTVSSNPDPTGTLGTYALTNVTNTFTVEFWARPNTGVSDDVPDPSNKYSGVDDAPPYAIFPLNGGDANSGKANMGVAVGVDGITVFEHANDYLPGVLDWRGQVTGWTHIAVVYNNLVPSLYVNGALVATGTASQKTSVSPSYNFGGGGYGYMPGGIDEVRIWSVARTPAQIATSYQQSLSPSDQLGLVGYWPMDNTNGSLIHDISCSGNDAVFISPATSWATSGAPINDTKYVPFAGRFIVPNHSLPTNYVYNSLNQVVQQNTPDAGTSTFLYDRLGRLAVSQNAEQLSPAIVDVNNPAGRFSYTRYDALGRITEVGEKLSGGLLSESDARTDASLQSWYTSGSNRQVTMTLYDQLPSWAPAGLDAGFPRKRVAATALLATGSDPSNASLRQAATYYRYDLDGNVAELMQENKQLVANEQQFVTGSTGIKDIKYEYDLISGKVNKVLYQDGKWDQFYYQYVYDADNRIIAAYTSRYNYPAVTSWTQEARYKYYLHGPLGRMELGPQVQGMDYAYTLQGWLKGVNGQQIADWQGPQTDMVGDGVAGNAQFGSFGRDMLGYSLGYYPGDYTPIGGSSASAFGSPLSTPSDGTQSGQPLYNGNIGWSTYAIGGVNTSASGGTSGFMGYTYRYDQLNRLVGMDAKGVSAYGSPSAWTQNTSNLLSQDYAERASYDGNGNILGYTRNGTGAGGRPQAMDQLTYNYNRDGNGYLVNNKLRHINDGVAAGNYPVVAGDPQDLDDQPTDNYSYDKIGNLIGNNTESIQRINWTVYGKMTSIAKTGVKGLSFGYDAGGNRITKTATAADGAGTTTHYVRDAQGNVLAVYQYKTNASGALTEGDWLEQHLYGSSRLGMLSPGIVIPAGQPLGNDGYGYSGTSSQDPVGISGSRRYELTNHLGNVLATITDKPVPLSGTMYSAELLSAGDYYPFGMQMPGRQYIAGSSLSYRYGFNGKENDNEVKGVGDQIDYGMRVYDPRVGRFMSVDPLTKKYPELTPYQYASNTPIQAIDLDGLEKQIAINGSVVYGPVNIDGVNASIISNQTKVLQAAMKQAYAERYIQDFRNRNSQQGIPSNPGNIQDGTNAIIRANLNDPDNIGGKQAYAIAQNLHDARVDFKEGNWGYGTLDLVNGTINTATLIGAGPALGVKPTIEIKTERGFVYADAANLAPPQFSPLPLYRNEKGEITNGKYTVINAKMEPHVNGDFTSDKSQFLYGVDYNKATLDAAAYADFYKLWDPKDNSAKVPVTNGNVGVTGITGQLTNYINVYRKNTGYVHSSPGNPPSTRN